MSSDSNDKLTGFREQMQARYRERMQARLDSEKKVGSEGKLAGRAEMVAAGTPGKKDDAGKQRWYAMPLCVLKDLADTFNHGAEEYGLFNCMQEFGEPKQRWWNALMRHLEECQIDPLAKDAKSGCYHAACVAFNALMYLYHCKRGAKCI